MSTTVQDTHEHNPLSAVGEALDSAAEAFGEATSDARASAKAAAKKVKSTVSTGVYKGAYGLSFGIVFGAVFLTELLPESSSLRRGFEDGATDALDSIASRKLQALSGSEMEEEHDVFEGHPA